MAMATMDMAISQAVAQIRLPIIKAQNRQMCPLIRRTRPTKRPDTHREIRSNRTLEMLEAVDKARASMPIIQMEHSIQMMEINNTIKGMGTMELNMVVAACLRTAAQRTISTMAEMTNQIIRRRRATERTKR